MTNCTCGSGKPRHWCVDCTNELELIAKRETRSATIHEIAEALSGSCWHLVRRYGQVEKTNHETQANEAVFNDLLETKG